MQRDRSAYTTWARPGLTKGSPTKQFYLSLMYQGLGICYELFKGSPNLQQRLAREEFALYKINYFRKVVVDKNYTKGRDR